MELWQLFAGGGCVVAVVGIIVLILRLVGALDSFIEVVDVNHEGGDK